MKKLFLSVSLLLFFSLCRAEEQPPFEVKDPAITEDLRQIYYQVDQLGSSFIQSTGALQSGTFNVNAATINIANINTITQGGVIVSSFTSSGDSFLGTTTNDDASAGFYGEYISSFSANGSRTNFPATGVYGDLLVITLTAGDWDINFCESSTANGATVSRIYFGIGTASGNTTTGLIEGINYVDSFPGPVAGSTNIDLCISGYRASISVTTTYYGKYRADYTVAIPRMDGILSARRRR